MVQIADIESIDSARLVLKSWMPSDEMSAELRAQLLDFIDIAEDERNRLIEQRDVIFGEQQQVEMALCHIEDAISVTSLDGSIRLVNPAFERLTGFKGDDIIGLNYGEVWGDIDSKKIEEIRAETSAGKNWEGILQVKSKSGDRLAVEATVVPIIHFSGQITHFVYALHNITRRVELEQNLVRQERFFEKVINLNPGIIIILDENGDWMLDNLAAKTLLTDLGEGARKKLSDLLIAAIRSKKTEESRKLTIPLPNGKEVIYMIFSEAIPATYLLPDSAEKEVFLITLSDITENERKNKEILIRQKALLASRIEKNMVQGEFINGFMYQAHKPINIAKAAVSRIQIALRENQTDQIETAIGLMINEIDMLENEFEKFRSMRQTAPPNGEVTEAAELIEAVKILYKDQTATDSVVIELENTQSITYPLPYEVMQLMLRILIDNAIEANRSQDSKTTARVTFEKRGEGALIVVEDNGSGIPKTDRNKVFEPFYTTKTNRSGLSLTILHQLLNNIKGSIEISCSELGGMKATLFFPVETS